MSKGRIDLLIVSSVILVTFISLWQWENYQGAATLDEVKLRVASHKGPDGFRSSSEKVPSEEDNFFGDPFLSCLIDFSFDPDVSLDPRNRVNFNRRKELNQLAEITVPSGDLSTYFYSVSKGFAGQFCDNEKEMAIWSAHFRNSPEYDVADTELKPAMQILNAMDARFGRGLSLMGRAVSRPASYIPSVKLSDKEYWMGEFSPYGMEFESMLGFLSLRMLAAIEAENTKVFCETFEIYLKFLEGLGSELNAASLFSVPRYYQFLLNALKVGIDKRIFSSADLHWIASQMEHIQFEKMVEGAMAEEIDHEIERFSAIRKRRRLSDQLFEGPIRDIQFRRILARIAPDGWIDRNTANLIGWKFEEGLKPWANKDFSSISSMEARYPSFQRRGTFLLLSNFGPALWSLRTPMEAYVAEKHAFTAIALERFSHEQGRYPEQLLELVPRYISAIPRDPFDGSSMRYILKEDRYILYSIGMNLSDEGGVASYSGGGRRRAESGDWIWDKREPEFPSSSYEERLNRALLRIELEGIANGPVGNIELHKEWKRREREKSPPTEEELLIERVKAKIKADKAAARP